MADESNGATTPAGWYVDPEGSGRRRYWDGERWTEHYAAAGGASQRAPARTGRGGRGCLVVGLVCVGLFAALVLVVAIAVAIGGDDAESGDERPADRSQLEEVAITACGPPDIIQVTSVEGTAENTSSKRSDYFIDLVVEAPDGTQLGTGFALVENVEPDQTATWRALTDVGDRWVDGATCRVVDVERNASV